MKIIKHNFLILWLLCCATAIGQTKKLDKTYKTNKDVTVHVDARYTNLVVEYWDKDEVQVEALLETTEKDKQEVERMLSGWNLDTKGSAGEVRINSSGATNFNGEFNMAAIEEPLSKLPEMLAPLQKMIGPMLESISSNPLPPEFYANMGDLNFDYEAYRKDGDKYLEKFEQKVEKKFGKDFEVAMENWAANFEKDSALWNSKVVVMENFGEEFGKNMEAWGEEFGKEMEKWGEEYGKKMEAWAKNFEEEVEAGHGNNKTNSFYEDKAGASKKLLRIKIPKSGQLRLNVRHGEVKLNGTASNLKADLSHSKFSANTISGKNTNIKVAYTPVKVNQWNYGLLNAAYVQDLMIEKAVSIKLESNSSDVRINELQETGIFKGSFGELVINRLAPGFQTVDISLENSDLVLDLPDVAYSLNYSGTKSEVSYPKELKLKTSNSYDNKKLKGYNKNEDSNASVNINAEYSEVLLK